jgi:hypothetical protein
MIEPLAGGLMHQLLIKLLEQWAVIKKAHPICYYGCLRERGYLDRNCVVLQRHFC